jgi:UDPglucose--hexose-1-phosphate uridylyltransferase
VFCKIIEHEMKVEKRLVYQNDKFIAMVPYASSVPYEIEIYPKRHEGGFDIMPGEDIVELSDCLRTVMRKLYLALSNPDFNIIFRNPPYHLSNILPYHWHLKVVPYLAVPGGFELGSAMRVNVMMPEDSASILRNTDMT